MTLVCQNQIEQIPTPKIRNLSILGHFKTETKVAIKQTFHFSVWNFWQLHTDMHDLFISVLQMNLY